MSDGHPHVGALKVYALVGYLPEPLGSFLTELRGELVPGCRLRSHVTLLPPRCLTASAAELTRFLSASLDSIPGIELSVGGVEIFESTNVVYLTIASGRSRLVDAHHSLNQGALAFREPYEFHPHVTLAQDFPPEQLDGIVERARERWNAWPHARTFRVDHLTFVTSPEAYVWETVSEHALRPDPLPAR